MHVFQDTIDGGEWHHCYDCGQQGDMIELAAAAWKLSYDGAIDRLRAEGMVPDDPEDTARLRRLHGAYRMADRKRAAEFWRQAQSHLLHSGSRDVASLRVHLRVKSQLPRDAWDAGPGHLLGACNAKQADKDLVHAPSQSPKDVHGIFRGQTWGDALVVPYDLAPGRPSGFLFAARRGPRIVRRFRMLRPGSSPGATSEAGLAGLWAADAADRDRHPHVFAVEDPFLAVRLQIRHFGTSTRPLPLVAWHDGPDARTTLAGWMALRNRQVVFWGFKPTASMIHQAMLVDGLMSIAKVEKTTVAARSHFLRSDIPTDILRRAARQARPWLDALAGWADGQDRGALEDLLLALERHGVDSGKIADRLGLPRQVTAARRSVEVAGLTVYERPDGWYGAAHRTLPRLLSEAILRIDTVVAGAEPAYEGRIILHGAEVPFSAPASILEDRNACKQFIVTECLRAGLPRPASNPNRVDLVEVAVAFHAPRTVLPIDDGT